jgi:hypothetical protein
MRHSIRTRSMFEFRSGTTRQIGVCLQLLPNPLVTISCNYLLQRVFRLDESVHPFEVRGDAQ